MRKLCRHHTTVNPNAAADLRAAVQFVEAVLEALDADHRRVAETEWGLTLEVAGWPLHVGMAVRAGILRVQAEAVGPGVVDPAALLHRNRLGVLVRYAHSRAGAVWIHGDLPAANVDGAGLDALLARLVEAAEWVRTQAQAP